MIYCVLFFAAKRNYLLEDTSSRKKLIISNFRSSAGLEIFVFFLIPFLRSHYIKTRSSHLLKAGLRERFFVAPHNLETLCELFCANKKYLLENTKCNNLIYVVKWFFASFGLIFESLFCKMFPKSLIQTFSYNYLSWKKKLTPQIMIFRIFRTCAIMKSFSFSSYWSSDLINLKYENLIYWKRGSMLFFCLKVHFFGKHEEQKNET